MTKSRERCARWSPFVALAARSFTLSARRTLASRSHALDYSSFHSDRLVGDLLGEGGDALDLDEDAERELCHLDARARGRVGVEVGSVDGVDLGAVGWSAMSPELRAACR